MSELTIARPEIRVVVDFDHVLNPADEWDFHEWLLTDVKVKADKRGRANPRMTSADWRLIQCNNMDCPAQALIYLNDVLNALPAAPVTAAS